MTQTRTDQPVRIGIVHLNQVGDLMFSLPALAALRAGFPRARTVSIIRESLEPLLVDCDLVDEVLLHRGARDFFMTLGRLRAAGLDLVVCLSQSPRARLLAYGSGASRRAGLGGGPLESLLTESVEASGLPSTGNNLRLTTALGCPTPRETYQGLLGAGKTDRLAVRQILAERGWSGEGDLVVFAGGASRGREHKEWPVDQMMEVCRRVAQEGAWSVIVGTDDRPGVEHAPDDRVLDLRRYTGLRELRGLLDQARLFVGIDSGVLHLGAALGTPCVALFGPTDPEETGPQGEGHRIVRADPSGHGVMEAIGVEAVCEAVEQALAASGDDPPVR